MQSKNDRQIILSIYEKEILQEKQKKKLFFIDVNGEWATLKRQKNWHNR